LGKILATDQTRKGTTDRDYEPRIEMNLQITILFACLLFGRLAHATPTGWSTNLAGVLESAAKQQQPVLVYFTASWCGPCKLMARTTLTNEAVRQLLGSLPHVALDLDEQPKLAGQYEIRAVPTFLMLAPTGEPVVTTTGFQDADTFLQWLTNGVSEVSAAITRQHQVAQKLVAVDQWLVASDRHSLQQAAAELIELCADRNETTRKAANARLATMVTHDPALLLAGLTHPRLSVRIQVSNLLRQQLGEGFEIDPWGDASARASGIAIWREKLAGAKAGN
jgi:thioredoxin 1